MVDANDRRFDVKGKGGCGSRGVRQMGWWVQMRDGDGGSQEGWGPHDAKQNGGTGCGLWRWENVDCGGGWMSGIQLPRQRMNLSLPRTASYHFFAFHQLQLRLRRVDFEIGKHLHGSSGQSLLRPLRRRWTARRRGRRLHVFSIQRIVGLLALL